AFPIRISPALCRGSRPPRDPHARPKRAGRRTPIRGRRPGFLRSGSVLLLLLGLLLRLVLVFFLGAALLLLALLLHLVALRGIVRLLVLSLGGRSLSGDEARGAEGEGNAHHQRDDLLHLVSPPFHLSGMCIKTTLVCADLP